MPLLDIDWRCLSCGALHSEANRGGLAGLSSWRWTGAIFQHHCGVHAQAGHFDAEPLLATPDWSLLSNRQAEALASRMQLGKLRVLSSLAFNGQQDSGTLAATCRYSASYCSYLAKQWAGCGVVQIVDRGDSKFLAFRLTPLGVTLAQGLLSLLTERAKHDQG